MKAFVTGASSFVGSEVCRQLLADGIEVWALVRPGSPNIGNLPEETRDGVDGTGFHIVRGDIADLDEVTRGFSGFDLFFSLVWIGNGHKDWHETDIQKQNIENSLYAIEVAKKIGARCFVFSGSQAEYGFMDGLTSEDAVCRPVTEYGKAKWCIGKEGAEKAATLGLKFLHLRIFSIYGEKDHPWTLITYALKKMLHNEPLELSSCLQKWNYIYVKDAACQISRLAQYALKKSDFKHEIFNIASEDTRPLADFIEEMCMLTGTQSEIRKAPPEYPLRNLQPSVQKTKNAIGFIADYTFREGMDKVVRYFKIRKARHLFFDLDGTLADTRPDILGCIEKAYKNLGFSYDKSKLRIGPPLPDIIAAISPQLNQEQGVKIAETFRERYTESGFPNTRLFPYMAEFLGKAEKEGKKIYVATNKPTAATRLVLEKLGIKGIFSYVGTPDSEGKTLSKGDVLLSIVRRFGLNPQDCVMVGDTRSDTDAGKYAGMLTLAYLGGYGSAEELRHEADYCIKSYRELL